MNSASPHNARSLEIKSRTELLGEVRAFVSVAAGECGFASDDIAGIELAVDEAITNIIKHAYKYDPDGVIRVDISTSSRRDGTRTFIISITDSGSAFDLSSYHPPDMKEYFQKLRRGGLGLVLMNKLMDEVDYDSHPGRNNLLRMVKYLPRQNRASA